MKAIELDRLTFSVCKVGERNTNTCEDSGVTLEIVFESMYMPTLFSTGCWHFNRMLAITNSNFLIILQMLDVV